MIHNPFSRVRVRYLFAKGLLVSLLSSICLGYVQGINGLTLNNQVVVLVLYILIFGLLCLWIFADFNRLEINLRYVVGILPSNYKWLPTVGLVVLVIVFSLSAYLVSFSLLSWFAPSLIEELLRQIASNASAHSSAPLLDNLLSAIAIIVVAPVAEEFIFRGVILQRWATKWGIRTALIVSSVLFGILHPNFPGLSMFGFVMGVLYIKTQTLIVPIACHGLNNLLALTAGFFSNQPQTTSSLDNLEQLRSGWWVGVLLMLISLPGLIRFLSRNWPRQNAPTPYLINASQANT